MSEQTKIKIQATVNAPVKKSGGFGIPLPSLRSSVMRSWIKTVTLC